MKPTDLYTFLLRVDFVLYGSIENAGNSWILCVDELCFYTSTDLEKDGCTNIGVGTAPSGNFNQSECRLFVTSFAAGSRTWEFSCLLLTMNGSGFCLENKGFLRRKKKI